MDIFLPGLDEKVMKQNIWVSLTTDRQVFEKHDLEKLQTRRPGIKEHIPTWILWVSIQVNFFTQNLVAPLPPVMQFWKWWNLDTYETGVSERGFYSHVIPGYLFVFFLAPEVL